MARLTAADRRALPKGDFAIPGRFPIPDKSHAIAAERDVNRAHGLKPGQKATILRKAHAMLGKSDNDADDVPMGRLDA
jgi:hypothetical protein